MGVFPQQLGSALQNIVLGSFHVDLDTDTDTAHGRDRFVGLESGADDVPKDDASPYHLI
jgi:hypothetical protein